MWGKVWKTGLGILDAYRQYDAGRDAKEQARKNAQIMLDQTAEQARRYQRQASRNLAQQRANISAGGSKLGGTNLDILSEVDAEQTAQLGWLKKAGATRARATRKAGDAYAKAGILGAATSLIGATKPWWKTEESEKAGTT